MNKALEERESLLLKHLVESWNFMGDKCLASLCGTHEVC